jgi:hypothetical protein
MEKAHGEAPWAFCVIGPMGCRRGTEVGLSRRGGRSHNDAAPTGICTSHPL